MNLPILASHAWNLLFSPKKKKSSWIFSEFTKKKSPLLDLVNSSQNWFAEAFQKGCKKTHDSTFCVYIVDVIFGLILSTLPWIEIHLFRNLDLRVNRHLLILPSIEPCLFGDLSLLANIFSYQ